MRHLIRDEHVSMFYVGNHGNFDRLVLHTLEGLQQDDPTIRICVVLAYFPKQEKEYLLHKSFETVYPHVLEGTPPKFAISRRNRWMIEQANCVVTYVTRSFGGAATFKEMAVKKGKTVIELSKY